ncbi:hypothetical protein J6590_008859 [Homalodisca vitripennis]|nr:hypothetical protein J6590_008859 [Homalodisca vitripennis]
MSCFLILFLLTTPSLPLSPCHQKVIVASSEDLHDVMLPYTIPVYDPFSPIISLSSADLHDVMLLYTIPVYDPFSPIMSLSSEEEYSQKFEEDGGMQTEKAGAATGRHLLRVRLQRAWRFKQEEAKERMLQKR